MQLMMLAVSIAASIGLVLVCLFRTRPAHVSFRLHEGRRSCCEHADVLKSSPLQFKDKRWDVVR